VTYFFGEAVKKHTEILVMNLTIITYRNYQNTSGMVLLLGVQPPNSIYMD
jgi:hypothetical protein